MLPVILKNLRKRKNVTQIQLAAAIGVSPGNVGDWETGKSHPNYMALIRLVKFFDVSADILLGLGEEGTFSTKLSDDESRLISQIRCLDDRDREEIIALTTIKYCRSKN